MKRKRSERNFIKLGLAGMGAYCMQSPVFGKVLSNMVLPKDNKLRKWSKEAAYYVNTPKGIKCKLCLQNCNIGAGFNPDYKLTNLLPTPFETLSKARSIVMEAGLNYVYIGNVPCGEGQIQFVPTVRKM